MANAPVVHIADNSPEHVAYLLLQHVATAEKKILSPSTIPTAANFDRKWLLDAYAECLEAVQKPGSRLHSHRSALA